MNRLAARSNFAFPSLNDIGRNLFLTDDLFSGMDEFFKDVKFPKYNTIVRGEDMEIEIALAGYDKEDIKIELAPENVLTVSSSPDEEGIIEDEDEIGYEYVHRGVASRNFKISWKISPTHEVGDISYINGMLRIPLISKTPPEPEVKVLEIK
jgi:molecular chaperone IbpA